MSANPNWQYAGATVLLAATGESITLDSWDETSGLWTAHATPDDPLTLAPAELAFLEYPVEGVGMVIDPEGEPGYRVRLPEGAPYYGQVTAYPAASGAPRPEHAAADIAAAIATPPPPPVPGSVTPRQLLLALYAAYGIAEAQILAQLGGEESARIEFARALSFEREHPLVAQLAAAMGLTSAQVDDLYRDAASR